MYQKLFKYEVILTFLSFIDSADIDYSALEVAIDCSALEISNNSKIIVHLLTLQLFLTLASIQKIW